MPWWLDSMRLANWITWRLLVLAARLTVLLVGGAARWVCGNPRVVLAVLVAGVGLLTLCALFYAAFA